MSTLPINITLSLNEAQKGALACKGHIIELIDGLNAVDCTDSKGDIDSEKLLEHRSKIIVDLVSQLGVFSVDLVN